MLGEVLYLGVLLKGITLPGGFRRRTALRRQTETQILDKRNTWLCIPTASQGDGSAHVLLSHDSQTIY